MVLLTTIAVIVMGAGLNRVIHEISDVCERERMWRGTPSKHEKRIAGEVEEWLAERHARNG